MPSQIGYFDTLKSAAGKVFSYLASITLAGTDGKTITVTQDTSLDEAVAMSSKAPKASPTFTAGIGLGGSCARHRGNSIPRQPIKNEMFKRGTFFELVWLKARGGMKKEHRIKELVPYYRGGYIYHNAMCPGIKKLEQQLEILLGSRQGLDRLV